MDTCSDITQISRPARMAQAIARSYCTKPWNKFKESLLFCIHGIICNPIVIFIFHLSEIGGNTQARLIYLVNPFTQKIILTCHSLYSVIFACFTCFKLLLRCTFSLSRSSYYRESTQCKQELGSKFFDELISLGYEFRFSFDSIMGSLLSCVERDLG